MNPEFEDQLAAKIQQKLNTLGELSAPPALAGRVLRAISHRNVVSWYRSAWQTWPMALQGAALVVLLLLFGGICLGFVELSHVARVSPAGQQAGEWFAWFGALCKTGGVVADALATAFRHIGTGVWIGCGLVLLAAYVACVGLGTACVRLAVGAPINRSSEEL